MKHRNLFGLLVVLAMVLGLFAACGPTAAPTEEPAATEEPKTEEPAPTEEPEEPEEPEPTEEPEEPGIDPSGQTVTYWYQHTGSREELMQSMIEDFNSSNEWGITVVGETQGGYNELYTKIIAGIPANQLPSMAVAYQNQAATYAVQGVLVPLDQYIADPVYGYTQEELDDFFPVALSADYLPQFGDRYGWPPYKSMEVMYYNQDWLEELGYDGPPTNWEEFAEMSCAAIEQPFSGQVGEGIVLGYEYSVDASRFATFLFSRGGDVLNENASSYVFNSAEGVETMAYWQQLVEDGCAAQATERYGDQTDFGAGRVLFTISSISGLSYYAQAVDEGAAFNWSVNPPPHSTAEPRMNIYGASQSIFASTPEEQLASWLFTKWLSEPEQQAKWASSTGYFPTRASAADMMADYMNENPTYAKAFQFMFYESGVESPVAGYDECRTEIANMLTNVLGGEDPKSELDNAVMLCNEYLEEAAP
ncbi:MAG: ABC transporter substrate-binding protein [Anaerolineae bacterium]|nr:ABC transporter substrate-binding protein [Anaerolineae bacterium]